MQKRQASAHTISSYRDTFRQFLRFAQQRLHQSPSPLTVEQIDAPLIVAFLDELEKQRESWWSAMPTCWNYRGTSC
jgi:site-specific recombinase XerD